MTVSPDHSPATGRKISLIFPVAGRESEDDFRGFEMARGESLVHRSLRSFAPYRHLIDKVYYVALEEHAARFDIQNRLAQLVDWPFELVCLSSATQGPAQTVARGVAKAGIAGPAIVCDVDHRLNVAPLFEAIETPDAENLASLWPLAGEELKRWSVASVVRNGEITSMAERRLPTAAGFFFGVIGCYYFRDIAAVKDRCLDSGFTRFSDYFDALATVGTPARGVRLEEAEFFGDAERIRALEAGPVKAHGTIFCDIDGTLIRHEDKPDYSRLPKLLPGSREKLRAWIADGYHVVLCTARRKEDEPKLVAALRELDVPFHQILTGLPSGMRVVINDRKPHESFTTQAASLEIARDKGIGALEIYASRKPTILRRFDGGSFAETLLVEEVGNTFVRKRAAKEGDLLGYRRLRDQFRTLERFAQFDATLVPALQGEENNSHEYFYDMEFLGGYSTLADCEPGARAAALDQLFDRFEAHLYCHKSRNQAAAEDWLLRHFQTKIDPKLSALTSHELLKPLLTGDGIAIDGTWHPSLGRLLEKMKQKEALSRFAPQVLSLVHGDLTFQNVMVDASGDVKAIDMEAQDSLEAVELDLGKIRQSTHSQYERWSRYTAPLCLDAADGLRLNFTPDVPDAALCDAVRRRWSSILGCSEDDADLKGNFYLGLHLVRMVPFRLKTSADHALYALATALQYLNAAVEGVAFSASTDARKLRDAA